jgi:hypothetical protein
VVQAGLAVKLEQNVKGGARQVQAVPARALQAPEYFPAGLFFIHEAPPDSQSRAVSSALGFGTDTVDGRGVGRNQAAFENSADVRAGGVRPSIIGG